MTDKDLEREAYEYANAQPVELFKALSKFQSECPRIHKGTKGHNYSYADLPTIFDVINPILEKNNPTKPHINSRVGQIITINKYQSFSLFLSRLCLGLL